MSMFDKIIQTVFGGGRLAAGRLPASVAGSLQASSNYIPAPRGKRPTSPEEAGPDGHWWIGGEYEVHRELGRGGMGVVYLAYSYTFHSLVALKTMHDQCLVDEQARNRFCREALAWVHMGEHPCVVEALGVSEYSGRHYVAIEYIPQDQHGRNSLSHYLRGEVVDPQQILRWSIQICHAMEHAYAQGLIAHRDLKPANVMIGVDARMGFERIAKVTDFGLAKVAFTSHATVPSSLCHRSPSFRQGPSALSTQAGTWLGTPGYMAPEQWEDASVASQENDIYSFGVILYQMANRGRHPFEVTSYKDLADYCQRIRVMQQKALLPPSNCVCGNVIARCLENRVENRYRAFAEARCDLEHVLSRHYGQQVRIPTQLENNDVLINRGASLSNLGRHEEALACLNRAIEGYPRNAVAWNNKGQCVAALGDTDGALTCYDHAIGIDPTNASTWASKGVSLSRLGRHEEALTCYDKALELHSRDSYVWTNKGNCLNSLGRRKESLDCYDMALTLDPRDATAWLCKGGSLESLGQYDDAIACYDKVLTMDPHSAPVWCKRASALDSAGCHEKAVTSYDKALAIEPRNTAALCDKGGCLDRLGRYAQAVACYDKVLAIDPRYAAAWFNKAVACEKGGSSREAAESYRRFLALNPSEYPAAMQSAREALRRLGGG